MAEPETVVLDRSGLVLRRLHTQCEMYSPISLMPVVCHVKALVAGTGFQACFASRWHDGTRDECLAWLDARVIELRAALLPPGSFVVADTDNTRAALNRALDPFKQICLDGVWRAHGTPDAITDAVLAALREAGR